MTYAAEVLADNPTAYWRLGEPNEFFNAHDESGNFNTGIYVGPPTLPVAGLLVPGDGDTAVDFDATSQDQYVIGTTDLGNTTYPTFSFEVLAQQTVLNLGPDTGTLIAMVASTYANAFTLCSSGASGPDPFYLAVWTGTLGSGFVSVPSSVTASVPHHWVITYDGTATKMYLDGALIATDATAAGALDFAGVTAKLFVGGDDQGVTGGNNGGGGGLTGTLDEAAFYDHALSAARVLAHANAAGFFPPDTNPPIIASITPGYGIVSGGDTVILSGAHFNNVTSLYFDGVLAPFWNVDSDTQITVTTPAHAVGSIAVDLNTDFGADSHAFAFTVDGGPPVGLTSECVIIEVPTLLCDGVTPDGDGIVYTVEAVDGWYDSIPMRSALLEAQPRGETIVVAHEGGRTIDVRITAHSAVAGEALGAILCFTATYTIKTAFRAVFVPISFRVVDAFADRTLLARRVGPIKESILGNSAAVTFSIPMLGEDPRRFAT